MQTLKKTCVLAYTIECTVLLLLSHNEVHWEEKHECMARVSSRTPFQHIDHLVPSIHNGLSVTSVLERLRLEPVPSKLMLKLVRGPSKRRGDFFLHILHTCVGVLWVALRSLQDPCTHVISHSGSCRIVEKHSVDVHVGKKKMVVAYVMCCLTQWMLRSTFVHFILGLSYWDFMCNSTATKGYVFHLGKLTVHSCSRNLPQQVL